MCHAGGFRHMIHQFVSSLFVSIAVVSLAFTSGAEAAVQTRTIRVLSYNIHGLPDQITKSDSERFADIGRILAERRKAGTAPDIVLIQEGFISRVSELMKTSGYPHVAKGPNATDSTETGRVQRTIYGSGLYVLSEFPIVETKKVAYDLALCADADCGANKGVMMTALEVPGLPEPLKVFNTHAQSVKKFDHLRSKQFEIFARFVHANRGTSAIIAGGDFNARPSDPAFTVWQTLSFTTSAGGFCVSNIGLCRIDPQTDVSKAYQDAVDHLFFSLEPALDSVTTRPVTVKRNFGEVVGGRVLSDHLGYEAEFEVSWFN